MTSIHDNKHYDRPSVFNAPKLLREARRQKNIPTGNVPAICVLDPDGDLFRHLRNSGANRNQYWACYHTEMYNLELEKHTIGVLGCAVGASFAVLVAEELFASGCQLLISVTSAGQITPVREPPYFVLIDHALRDEGTSYHYLPPAQYARIQPDVLKPVERCMPESLSVIRGGTWTTDAPFRETNEAIAFARSQNLLAVEMEAGALYAFAEAKHKPVVCFAHVTNTMATTENDFEKGEADGNHVFIDLITAIAESVTIPIRV